MKGRKPKPEARRKLEIRGPNANSQVVHCGMASVMYSGVGRTSWRSGCGSRISAFLRPSGLGLRVLAAACLLRFARSALAATNSPGADEIPRLRPPHAEIPPGFWEAHGVGVVALSILGLALVCAAVWILIRPKPPVVVPPEVQARRALEPMLQQPEDGALLSRVSQVLRHYVAAAFDLPAGELTTAEFCRAIEGHAQIGPELSIALGEFLRQGDQRKFALPALGPPLGAVAQAFKLIDQAQARRLALAQAAGQAARSPMAAVAESSPPK